MEITDLPEFAAAQAEYLTSRRAAVAAGDELAQAKAEAAWAQKQVDLTRIAYERQAAGAAVEAAKADVARDHPRVPAAAYQHLTDPAAIRQVAAAIDQSLGQINPPQAPQPPQQAQPQSWGGSPPATPSNNADAGQPDPMQEWREKEPALEAEILKAKNGDPRKQREWFDNKIDQHIGSRFNPASRYRNVTWNE